MGIQASKKHTFQGIGFRVLLTTFLFIPFWGFPQFSQEVEKTKDKRYITTLSEEIPYAGKLEPSGLVKNIELGIEWWSLLGEPVEKYLFRWEKGGSVFSGKHGIPVSENELSKYPDLASRYKKLKPSKITLQFHVVFQLHGQDIESIEFSDCLKRPSLSLTATRTVNSLTHLFIDKPGKTGDDLVPSSPKNWAAFLNFSSPELHCSPTSKEIYSIFKKSYKATFYGLQVLEIKVPQHEIDAIVGEYLKRENGEGPEENAELENEENENKAMGQKPPKNDWGDLGDEPQATDDGWGSAAQKMEQDNWGSAEGQKAQDNSWDFDTQGAKGQNESTGENNSFEIPIKGDKQGVVDKNTGQVLIPFRKWDVVKYYPDTNIAKVRKLIDVRDDASGKNKIYEYHEGIVDNHGNWLADPTSVKKYIPYLIINVERK